MPHLIEQANKLSYKIGIFPICEYWNDIGTPKSLIFEKKEYKINKLYFKAFKHSFRLLIPLISKIFFFLYKYL